MRVLVSGSTKTMREIGNVPNLGVFFNPNSKSNYRKQCVPDRMPWAADNAAFSNFNASAFESMIDTLHWRRIPGCLFVAVPDVVGDAVATCRKFREWQPLLRRFGWPLAFVGQDGAQYSSGTASARIVLMVRWLARQNRIKKIRYRVRVALRLCPECCEPVSCPVLCGKCQDYHRDRMRMRRA